jgi:hypothetical protein
MAATALNTVADYVAQARVLLQDTLANAYRYSDIELVQSLNLGLIEARRLRADLFLGRDVPIYAAADATLVDFEDQFRMSLLYYVVGNAQLRDEEDTQDERSVAFINRFIGQLLQVAA